MELIQSRLTISSIPTFRNEVLSVNRLAILENNSEHYPIVCTLSICLDRSEKEENRAVKSQKVKWKRVDIEAYTDTIL